VANSPEFVAHALELLSGVGPVEARAMFGGHGVYARGVMFGLLDDDELFLKTDDLSRPRFAGAGCRSWVYVGPTQKLENTSYYRPPDDAHEDPEAMLAWATLALDAALRLRAAKSPRTGRKTRAKGTPVRGAKASPARGRPASGKRRPKPSRRRARPR
jgi:DNA transformation protein